MANKTIMITPTVDEELFKKQKQHFVDVMMSGSLTPEQQESFDGLVNLLDEVTDALED